MKIVNDDYSLWQSLKDEDRESFATIYFKYFNKLYEYGMRIVCDKELVKDCIQDLFVKLWTNKKNLGNVSNLRAYLLVSLRSAIYNKMQQSSRIGSEQIDNHNNFEMVFSVEAEFIKKEMLLEQTQKLMDAMNQLTNRQKEVIYLRYFEELDYDEIAVIMDITVKASYKLMARGLEMLRQILNVSNSSLAVLLTLVRIEIFQ